MGQGISLIGTWMQNLALGWLVYKLTGSELLLGVVGFSSQILTFAAAPFAGVLADRVNRRTLLVITQSVALVQALILAILTLMKHADGKPVIQVWHIVALSALLGLVMGFDMPTRQSFVVEMLEDRSDLPNAIALNSFMFNGARLIGPSVAGVVIKLVGEGTCFLLNAISFLAVIAALLAMKVQPKSAEAASRRVLHSLKEGAQYVAGHKPILALLLLLATLSLVGMPYAVLMPVFAKKILQRRFDDAGLPAVGQRRRRDHRRRSSWPRARACAAWGGSSPRRWRSSARRCSASRARLTCGSRSGCWSSPGSAAWR